LLLDEEITPLFTVFNFKVSIYRIKKFRFVAIYDIVKKKLIPYLKLPFWYSGV